MVFEITLCMTYSRDKKCTNEMDLEKTKYFSIAEEICRLQSRHTQEEYAEELESSVG